MSNIVEEHSDQCSLEGWHSNIRFCAAFVIDKTINELVCGHVESMYVITSSFDESLLEGGVIILSKNSVHDVVEGSLGCRSSGSCRHGCSESIGSEGTMLSSEGGNKWVSQLIPRSFKTFLSKRSKSWHLSLEAGNDNPVNSPSQDVISDRGVQVPCLLHPNFDS